MGQMVSTRRTLNYNKLHSYGSKYPDPFAKRNLQTMQVFGPCPRLKAPAPTVKLNHRNSNFESALLAGAFLAESGCQFDVGIGLICWKVVWSWSDSGCLHGRAASVESNPDLSAPGQKSQSHIAAEATSQGTLQPERCLTDKSRKSQMQFQNVLPKGL